MSYLDPPRFHFFGTFMATPSTINNATENYPLNVTYNDNPPGPDNRNSVFWWPEGTAFFTLPVASVTGAVGTSGPVSGDPIIGAQITELAWGGPPAQMGRISDLDPDMQMRSLVVGLRIAITLSGGNAAALTGTMRPANILDFWVRNNAGACMYMSVLEDLQWGDVSTSPLLQQLKSASPAMLSIKFNLDLYDNNPADPPGQFQTGRIAGTIGPYADGEGVHVLNARRMWSGSPLVSQNTQTQMFSAPFKISGTVLRLDLGNSVPTNMGSPLLSSTFMDIGPVGVAIDPAGQNLSIPVYSTASDYAAQYNAFAGIYDIDLGENAGAATGKPLAVWCQPPQPAPVPDAFSRFAKASGGIMTNLTVIAIAENPDGFFAAMEYVALRLQNGAPSWVSTADANDSTEVTGNANVPVYCTKFGAPADTTIAVFIVPNQYQWPSPAGENPWFINNVPLSAISFEPAILIEGGVGTARFTAGPLNVAQKEPRRASVDGQLYTFSFTHTMDPVSVINPNVIPLTILVFEDSPVVENPTWTNDIQPFLTQYSRLYPFMTKNVVDLSDYAAVQTFAGRIQAAINRPRNDPSFMPVTRDLSLRRVDMLNRWFAAGMPE